MKYLFIQIVCVVLIVSCRVSDDCDKIPTCFPSYPEAIKIIKSHHFETYDSLPDAGGSFIAYAEYYGCSNGLGYLFFKRYNGHELIVTKVPIDAWKKLKQSKNRDSFYFENIHDKFGGICVEVVLEKI